jgi:hypothetical protein
VTRNLAVYFQIHKLSFKNFLKLANVGQGTLEYTSRLYLSRKIWDKEDPSILRDFKSWQIRDKEDPTILPDFTRVG